MMESAGRRAEQQSDRESAYWLAVAQVPYIGPMRIERLVQRFGSLEAAWTAPLDAMRAVLDPRPLRELVAARERLDPLRELERLAAAGIHIAHPGHRNYPRLLAEISGPPPILYMRGAILPADDTAVAIVGTRRATPYGRQSAELIASELARAGITVISGLARGVDAAAHRAALNAGGRTIAVLGSGPDVIYPPEHDKLAEQILEHGAIVTEQPPGAKPDAPNFPARNRIISGMSLGVVVIEAALRSGALITASFAADQGREVFVVPGSVFAPSSDGTNGLLRDGARMVRDGNDVLEDLSLGRHLTAVEPSRQLVLDLAEQRLYNAIDGEARHIDELAEVTGMPAAAASATIVKLELKGLVRNHGAQYYVKR